MIENLHMLNEIGWLVIVTVIILIFTIANQTFDLVSKFCSNFGIKTVRSIERENATKNINILLEQMEELKKTREEDVKRSIKHDEQLKKSVDEISKRLEEIELGNKKRELNKIRDRLLQSHRYYTSTDKNPLQAWTIMESDAFWEMFGDYEELGGDGYMHTVVEPAMRQLIIVDMTDTEGISHLMSSRK